MKKLLLIALLITISNYCYSQIRLGFYPQSQALSYKLGDKIQFEHKLSYEYVDFFKEYWINQDFRFLYNWNKSENVNFYSGISLDTKLMVYKPDKEFLEAEGWYELVPLGLDIYPVEKIPGLSLCLEAKTIQFSNLFGTISLFYKINAK